MAKEKFEEALNKLEKIVSRLEKGDIPLEESLKLFEEGIRLSRFCNQRLDEAEKRVEILVKDRGMIRAQPFAPSANSGQFPSSGAGQVSSIESEGGASKSSNQEDFREARDLFPEGDESGNAKGG